MSYLVLPKDNAPQRIQDLIGLLNVALDSTRLYTELYEARVNYSRHHPVCAATQAKLQPLSELTKVPVVQLLTLPMMFDMRPIRKRITPGS